MTAFRASQQSPFANISRFTCDINKFQLYQFRISVKNKLISSYIINCPSRRASIEPIIVKISILLIVFNNSFFPIDAKRPAASSDTTGRPGSFLVSIYCHHHGRCLDHRVSFLTDFKTQLLDSRHGYR